MEPNPADKAREELARALAENGVSGVEDLVGNVFAAPENRKQVIRRQPASMTEPAQQPAARPEPRSPEQERLDSMNGSEEVSRRLDMQRQRRIMTGTATEEDRRWLAQQEAASGDDAALTNVNHATRAIRVEHEKPAPHLLDYLPGFTHADTKAERAAVNTPASGYATTPRSHIEQAGSRERELDSRWQEIVADDWPSNLQWCEAPALMARRFSVNDFLTISDWAETNDHAYLLQALDATLSVSVYDLPIADGVFFLYWHRMRSYPKSPRTLDWKCETVNEDFPGCGFENHTELKRQNLAVQSLRDIGFNYANIDPRADLPRMALYSEFIEFENCRAVYSNYLSRKLQWDAQVKHVELGLLDEVTLEKPKPPKLKFAANQLSLYQAAFWVRAGSTLEEKKEILLQEGDGELMQLCLNLSRNVHYGVLELAAVDCAKCQAQRQFRLTMEPASFVP